ncbi:facilitated trehalose transporter Tret1-like isoform X1 [Diorhabda sublineata]|uniref:facilitated trehalose transporter Tret1-like isoform X1 n=1 Tax=Diorhabda sublineata TaxID=1163346 RepID=UPI0024E19122|nr:facilitated trehalose transporter Tret1-like isoform X1 [Diorhabda sublineata]
MASEDNRVSNSVKPTYSSLRRSLPQIIAVCIKNCLLFVHGMSLGFPTILIPGVSGRDLSERVLLNEEEISWISSLNLICIPLGCLVSGSVTQAVGRKRAMQFINIPFITAWIILTFSTTVWQIFLALCILGFSGGLMEAPVLTYVAEITQPHLRGILSSTSTMSVTLGMLSQFILGTCTSWRTVTLINCIVPILSFISLTFVPETPVWLLSKNRSEEAKRSIVWLRGWTSVDDIQDEFQELSKQIHLNQDNVNSRIEKLSVFTKRIFLYPCLLISFVFVLNTFNGYGPFQVYAIKIFDAMQVSLDSYRSTIIVGAMQLVGAVVCVTSISFLGKRKLNFFSLFLSGICCFSVATYAYFNNINYFDETNTSEVNPYNWIPTLFLILFGFFSYLGIRVLPFILIGEIFAVEIRAFSSGFSAGLGYVVGFVANKTFLTMVGTFGLPAVFWFYSAVGILGTLGLYFALPETEGKSLYEISEHFAGRSRLRNSVRRKSEKSSRIEDGIHNIAFETDDKVESRL